MAGAKIIKQILAEREISIKELAEKLEISPQNMSNKLYRDNFSYTEMIRIVDILDCDIKVVTRDTRKEFS